MERKYFFDLSFSNNKIVDAEHAEWTKESINPDYLQYIKINGNTLRVSRPGCYLEHTNPIVIDTNKFTIAFNYKIDKIYYQKTLFQPKVIYSFGWNSGDIKVLDFDDEGNTYITIKINNNNITIPADYLTHHAWNHLLISSNNGLISVFHNGVKCSEAYYSNITYTFNYVKLGNYMNQEQFPEGPVVEYQYCTLVNDCLYKEDFDATNHNFHLLFPEGIYNDEEVTNSNTNTIVAAPYLYSSKDSYNDIIHRHEIIRHRNYKPDKSMQYLKYNFE